MFSNRQACVAFMQRLMNKQLFHRAVKVYKDQVEASKAENPSETPTVRKRKANDEKKSSPKASPSAKENTQKRKFKLEICDDNRFVDANEPFVWIYDPTSTKTYIIGSLLILGAIGVCLFPLWPSQVREGVYYVSLAGASFLGVILGLAVFKYILFAIIWACTFGKVHFWLLPNLTEDVGFYESFVPIYKCNSAKTSNDKKPSQEPADNEEKVEAKKEENEAKAGKKSVPNTPKASKQASDPTVETSSESPNVRRKASTPEDDGFELVGDDDDLVKS
jgi:translocation protein SEC62